MSLELAPVEYAPLEVLQDVEETASGLVAETAPVGYMSLEAGEGT
jgi:hypothetical protein